MKERRKPVIFSDEEIAGNFVLKTSDKRIITPGGLETLGVLFDVTKLKNRLNKIGKNTIEKLHQNFSCAMSYIGLLCQGKSDYNDVTEMIEDASFYTRALKINSVPSEETLRQRLDELGLELQNSELLMEENAKLLKLNNIEPETSFTGHVPIDADVSVHDNSGTKKEGVEWTYQGNYGFAPMYAYIGKEGYMLNVELRKGSEHSQCEGTLKFFENTIKYAKEITTKKLLFRLDSGNDAGDNIKLFVKENVDFLIKRNIRKESINDWFETAKEHGEKDVPRDGKTVYTGSIFRTKCNKETRIVFKITERTILANGQTLLTPDIDVQTWWTSLTAPEADIIRLYREHATCEQFHSEIKTDLGLERFPSQKFATNALVLRLAALAYNTLKIIGQTALKMGFELTKRNVERLRCKTVIQRFINIAAQVVTHSRIQFLDFGRSNKWRNVFINIHAQFV